MYPFFVTLYYSIFTGGWYTLSEASVYSSSLALVNNALAVVVNALGGNFDSWQAVQLTAGVSIGQPFPFIWAVVLAVITMFGICVAVWKITKALFAVFFRGAR